jgi:hypothetical protein
MAKSRRTFFEAILAPGGLTALLAESAGPRQNPSDEALIKTSDFWGSSYDSVDERKSRGRRVKRKPAVVGKDVRYLYFDEAGLRYTDQLKSADLLDHPGDVADGFPGASESGGSAMRSGVEHASQCTAIKRAAARGLQK